MFLNGQGHKKVGYDVFNMQSNNSLLSLKYGGLRTVAAETAEIEEKIPAAAYGSRMMTAAVHKATIVTAITVTQDSSLIFFTVWPPMGWPSTQPPPSTTPLILFNSF